MVERSTRRIESSINAQKKRKIKEKRGITKIERLGSGKKKIITIKKILGDRKRIKVESLLKRNSKGIAPKNLNLNGNARSYSKIEIKIVSIYGTVENKTIKLNERSS